jgi:hypothetical protein
LAELPFLRRTVSRTGCPIALSTAITPLASRRQTPARGPCKKVTFAALALTTPAWLFPTYYFWNDALLLTG